MEPQATRAAVAMAGLESTASEVCNSTVIVQANSIEPSAMRAAVARAGLGVHSANKRSVRDFFPYRT